MELIGCHRVRGECFYSIKIGEKELFRTTMYCDSLFENAVWTTEKFEHGDIYYFAKSHMRLWSYGIECYERLITIQLFLMNKLPILKEKQRQKKKLLMPGKKYT